uniref:Uncharacterized protein n=1 Tax=Oryza nivara TaxID=4536 RepID=A0A0E0HIH3_ORYNI
MGAKGGGGGEGRAVIHTASETRLKLRRVKVVDVEKSKSLSLRTNRYQVASATRQRAAKNKKNVASGTATGREIPDADGLNGVLE